MVSRSLDVSGRQRSSKRALSWKKDSVEKSMTRYWLALSKPETLDVWLATRLRIAQLAMGVR